MQLIKHLQLYFSVFSILFIVSFSFPFHVIPNLGGWLEPLFNELTVLVGGVFFNQPADSLQYHSGEDSIGMLINTVTLLFVSGLIYGLLSFRFKQRLFEISPYVVIFFRYYLAIMLLIYGFDKIYKFQFYYPEPNILYTKFKDLPMDLRYWSTMGTSYSYSLFAGLIEVIPAILLLWRRTYLIGALIVFMVLANVFMTNIGFDITIKLYSFFLLSMCFILLLPNLKNIWMSLTQRKTENSESPNLQLYKKQYYIFLKVFVLIVFFFESQYKLIVTGSFNDDKEERPLLHGAYQVFGDMQTGVEWERIYFHRQGYFIVEDTDGQFYDYKMKIDTLNHQLNLTTYEKETISFDYIKNVDTLIIYDEELGFKIKAMQVYKY